MKSMALEEGCQSITEQYFSIIGTFLFILHSGGFSALPSHAGLDIIGKAKTGLSGEKGINHEGS